MKVNKQRVNYSSTVSNSNSAFHDAKSNAGSGFSGGINYSTPVEPIVKFQNPVSSKEPSKVQTEATASKEKPMESAPDRTVKPKEWNLATGWDKQMAVNDFVVGAGAAAIEAAPLAVKGILSWISDNEVEFSKKDQRSLEAIFKKHVLQERLDNVISGNNWVRKLSDEQYFDYIKRMIQRNLLRGQEKLDVASYFTRVLAKLGLY